jgi:antagonist of KipI
MDSFALRVANALVGNELGAAVLEWALGGGSLTFGTESVVANTGAKASLTISGKPVAPHTATPVVPGDVLEVGAIGPGRFLYLAIAGGIDVPVILGSRSTYLPGKFGGYSGRSLKKGDRLSVLSHTPARSASHPPVTADLIPRYQLGVVHVMRGTHADLFDDAAWSAFLEANYRVAHASDRTGYRLEGGAVPNPGQTLPSEAGCTGVIQIPADGNPIVLMADAPTVGGYPKIAVVSEADMPILAQSSPGERIRFELTTIEQSQRALRKRAGDLEMIRRLGTE